MKKLIKNLKKLIFSEPGLQAVSEVFRPILEQPLTEMQQNQVRWNMMVVLGQLSDHVPNDAAEYYGMKSCRYCGKHGMRWGKQDGNWRLFEVSTDATGVLHTCPEYTPNWPSTECPYRLEAQDGGFSVR